MEMPLTSPDHLMKFRFCFSTPPRVFCPLERRVVLGKGPGLKLRGQLAPHPILQGGCNEEEALQARALLGLPWFLSPQHLTLSQVESRGTTYVC